MRPTVITCAASLVLAAPAGCGHSHPPRGAPLSPGVAEPPSPHDGVIRGNGRLNLELAQRPERVDIHVLDSTEKPIAVDGAVMHVACHTSSGASRWVRLAPKDEHFELPWSAADGRLEDATLEVMLARSKPPLDERFDIRFDASAPRRLEAKTRIATAAWGGVVRRLSDFGRTDGYVAVQISVSATLPEHVAIENEIARALTSHPELRVSQRIAAGGAISTGGGGHAHVTESTLDPFPQLTLDVTGSVDTAQIVLRQKHETTVLWQTAVPLSP